MVYSNIFMYYYSTINFIVFIENLLLIDEIPKVCQYALQLECVGKERSRKYCLIFRKCVRNTFSCLAICFTINNFRPPCEAQNTFYCAT